MNPRLSAFDTIYSLNGLADCERLGRKVDILHLQSAQLAGSPIRSPVKSASRMPEVRRFMTRYSR